MSGSRARRSWSSRSATSSGRAWWASSTRSLAPAGIALGDEPRLADEIERALERVGRRLLPLAEPVDDGLLVACAPRDALREKGRERELGRELVDLLEGIELGGGVVRRRPHERLELEERAAQAVGRLVGERAERRRERDRLVEGGERARGGFVLRVGVERVW